MTLEESEMKCSAHRECTENEGSDGTIYPRAGPLLDQEFKFFLYLAKPLVRLMPDLKEKALCSIWVLTLAKVRTCACIAMKAIRNDYMQALLGYLQSLRLVCPFNRAPPDHGNTLKPLAEIVKINRPSAFLTESVVNPCSPEAEDFMQNQPIPESGAFCYIAVTGKADETMRVSNEPIATTKFDSYLAR